MMVRKVRGSMLLVATAVSCASATQVGRAADHASWQAYADCAAGYRANWKDRLSDPTRTREMRDSIEAQSDEYETAAVRRYRAETGESETKAKQAVQAYVQANLPRFVDLDKRDELNSLLDKCPQPDDSGTL